MVKVLLPNSDKIVPLTMQEVEKVLGFRWVNQLQFATPIYEQKVRTRSSYAIRKKELNLREKWLGVRFHPEISSPRLPSVSIRWIDEGFGYGVFAERDFPAGVFVGEYTGLIRKRTPRTDRTNDYCFEYTIGDWLRNPFIIDAKGQGNFTRFINHSDDPNIETLSVYADGVMHIVFLTMEPIERGTQLGYHYGDYFWKKRRDVKTLHNNTLASLQSS